MNNEESSSRRWNGVQSDAREREQRERRAAAKSANGNGGLVPARGGGATFPPNLRGGCAGPFFYDVSRSSDG